MNRKKATGNRQRRAQRGFTLLLAALVASIVLALGTSIFQLAQKELTLSSIGRDSQYAFYAADTGVECALYWDTRFQTFPTTTPAVKNINCDNQSITTASEGLGNTITSTFRFEPNGFCVDVTVEKTRTPSQNTIHTSIRANGYSAHCNSLTTYPRLLQRSVELNY